MSLRLFSLSKCANSSLKVVLNSIEAIGSSLKYSNAAGTENRIKVIKPDLSLEDDVNVSKSKPKAKSKNVEKKKRSTLTVVTPSVGEKVIKGLQNVVGLHVGPSSIQWAKIQRCGNVLDWSYVTIFPITGMSKKIQLPQLYEEVSSMLEHIPVGDLYILEGANHVQPSLQSLSTSSTALLRAQLLAMLVALLNCRVEYDLASDSQEDFLRELDRIHKVYFLRPRIMSRLFHLLVGTERVSALDLVESIINGSSNLKDFADENKEENGNSKSNPLPIFTPVNIPSDIAASYRKLRAVEREEMCQALLVAMTFFDLVVFKDPKVLAPLQL